MPVRLPALPTEVVESIAKELPCTDLYSFRLVCKALCQKSFKHFCCSCFTTIETDLSKESLNRLRAIAQQDDFRQHVQILTVKNGGRVQSVPKGPRGPEGSLFGLGYTWHRHPTGYLDPPLQHAEILKTILVERMINCRSFKIHAMDDINIHFSTEKYQTDRLTPTDAIGVALAIIADTALPITSLHTYSIRSGSGYLDTNRLNTTLFQRQKFKLALKHLEELDLEHVLTQGAFPLVAELTEHLQSLHSLSIKLEHVDNASECSRRYLTLVSKLLNLRNFRLIAAEVSLETMTDLLFQSNSRLRSISFQMVRLASPATWVEVFKSLKGRMRHLERFSVVCPFGQNGTRGICNMFPELNKYPVVPGPEDSSWSNSGVRSVPWLERPVRVYYNGYKERRRIIGACYDGPDMDNFLDLLANTARYSTRQGPDVETH